MRRVALGVVGLYPEAWRERYGAELRALLAEQAIGPSGLVDLLRGCADAHTHPGSVALAPRDQMRTTAGAGLCCWIGFVICGAGFAKLTEDHPFGVAGSAHPLIGVTRAAIAVIAFASVAAVVLGGGRLIVEVAGEALRERRRPCCGPSALRSRRSPASSRRPGS